MKRRVDELLVNWKNNPKRKPLIVNGARQVGKTYSLIEFAEKHFRDYAYFNFEANVELLSVFEKNLDPQRIMMELGVMSGKNITSETLIFFDEIQAAPRAVTSLKYFCEKKREQPVVCAGSLLGGAIKRQDSSFPVGKVNLIDMYPMSFEEFLSATGNDGLREMIYNAYLNQEPVAAAIHSKAMDLYRLFLAVGGMPEVVKEYTESGDLQRVRIVQAEILRNYTADMAKYATSAESVRHETVFNSLPAQLAKENRKFQFRLIGSHARAREYASSIDWLSKAGVVLRCDKVSEGRTPLESYKDLQSYKIYMSDVGLLTAKQMLPFNTIMVDKNMNADVKGAMTENYLAAELKANGHALYYWESNNTAEVDFCITSDGAVLPIECKSGERVRSKSLSVFIKKYDIKKSIRISAKNFGEAGGIYSVPLYAAWCIR